MADFYRATPAQHDGLFDGIASEPVKSNGTQVADYSRAQGVTAFESSKFSAYGITSPSGGAIVGRDIRDTDLITIDGVRMQIGSARHLGLINSDRR